MPKFILLVSILIQFSLQSCSGQKIKNKKELESSKKETVKKKLSFHNVFSDDATKNCTCALEFELKDSSKLTHLKELFYMSETGHLYEITIAQKEIKGQKGFVDVTYFNGNFSQEVDPYTFQSLDGWYAKDKNNVYFYRPVSGGMMILKIYNADCKSFKILEGHYKYAVDKNYFYEKISVIKGFNPKNTKILKDKNKKIVGILSGRKKFEFYN
jgi:DKNYY family